MTTQNATPTCLSCFEEKDHEEVLFHKLMDIALQAKKDKLLGPTLVFYENYIDFDLNGVRHLYKLGRYEEGIEFIKTLYKSSFIINQEKDLYAIKGRAKVTLTNGTELIFSNIGDEGSWFEHSECHSVMLPYIVLKGATVEQPK